MDPSVGLEYFPPAIGRMRCAALNGLAPRRSRPVTGFIGERCADQPVVAVGIHDAALAKPVGMICDRGNLGCSESDRSLGEAVRVADEKIDPDGGAVEGLRAEVRSLWR